MVPMKLEDIKHRWLENATYYKDLICECEEPQISYARTPDHPLGDHLYYGLCLKCNKVPVAGLNMCVSCKSMFYHCFSHPLQKSKYDDKSPGLVAYCWRCLENGKSPGLDPIHSRLRKIPPGDRLLNPYIEPPDYRAEANKAKALLDKLKANLNL